MAKGIIKTVKEVGGGTLLKADKSQSNNPIIKNETKNITSQCQILVWVWDELLPRGDAGEDPVQASKAKEIDISNHLIDSVTFSKTLSSPAGQFMFRLDSTRDWKDIIKPGMWCVILMANDGFLQLPNKSKSSERSSYPPSSPYSSEEFPNHKVRGMCYIDRVGVNTSVDQNGAFNIHYDVSGRDYGLIYEETTLWFNKFKNGSLNFPKIAVKISHKALAKGGFSPLVPTLLETVHDLFYAPHRIINGKTPEDKQIVTSGTQWLLPKAMLDKLEVEVENSQSYYGNIKGLFNFAKTAFTQPLQPALEYIKGTAWGKLKELSVTPFHELFPELDDDGHPKLNFRPIPWGIDQRGYPQFAPFVEPYVNLLDSDKFPNSRVDLNAIDLISFNLGEDNHSRYNHFLTDLHGSVFYPNGTIGILSKSKSKHPEGRIFPFLRKGEVQRHGFRPQHVNVNAISFNLDEGANPAKKKKKGGLPKTDQLIEVNEIFLDYWDNAVFFEAGSLSMIGKNDTRVGKVLLIDKDIPYMSNKMFYIEGYTDEFIIEPNGSTMWTQTLQLTRGIELSDLLQIANLGSAKGQPTIFGRRSDKNQKSVISGELTLDSKGGK